MAKEERPMMGLDKNLGLAQAHSAHSPRLTHVHSHANGTRRAPPQA